MLISSNINSYMFITSIHMRIAFFIVSIPNCSCLQLYRDLIAFLKYSSENSTNFKENGHLLIENIDLKTHT